MLLSIFLPFLSHIKGHSRTTINIKLNLNSSVTLSKICLPFSLGLIIILLIVTFAVSASICLSVLSICFGWIIFFFRSIIKE